MTNMEILNSVINILSNINVPTYLLEQIGIPLYNATVDLKDLRKAIVEREKNKAEKEESSKKPEEASVS